SAKRLELLRETIPEAAQVAVCWNPASPQDTVAWGETQRASQILGLALYSLEVRSRDELDSALDIARLQHLDAFIALADEIFFGGRKRLVDFANGQRLPAMYYRQEYVEAGGLMSYGPSYTGLHRQAAAYVDKILKGAKPADLPVEQARTFDFVVNLRTAHA